MLSSFKMKALPAKETLRKKTGNMNMNGQALAFVAFFAGLLHAATAFTTNRHVALAPRGDPSRRLANGSPDGAANGEGAVVSVDVSEFGVMLADLEAPLPQHAVSFASSGHQSTSRAPGVDDGGCDWSESHDDVDVTLRIPGLIGQPAEALSVLFSTTTISITAFGKVVWSCIQMGVSDVDDCTFMTLDGEGGVPIVQLSLSKRDAGERWGGFILQIGEDSIL